MHDEPAATSGPNPSLIEQAWKAAYVDPGLSLASGRQIIAMFAPAADGSACEPADRPALAQGWLLVALAEVRIGDAAQAAHALAQARQLFEAERDARGQGLCDEVQVMLLRRKGRHADARALLAVLDTLEGIEWNEHDQFLRHNSRGVSMALNGQAHEALRHFYTALDAARASRQDGALITALGNLGSHHLYLNNLEDARTLCEEALQASQAAGAPAMVVSAAVNLVAIHRLLGRHADLQRVADVLRRHPGRTAAHTHTGEVLALATATLYRGDITTTRAHLDDARAQGLHLGRQALFWVWLQARCLMAQGEHDEAAASPPDRAVQAVDLQGHRASAMASAAAAARALIDDTLAARAQPEQVDSPQDVMELHAAAAEACERLGDLAGALDHTRRGHRVFQALADQGTRARLLALQVSHDVDQARRERDAALRLQQRSHEESQRLRLLNLELQRRIDETARLQALLREQALHDPLTGLFNRRYLSEAVPGLLDLAGRQQRPLAVAMIDLDHFKRLNDAFGHDAGDRVLRRFAALLLHTLRRSDVVCRYGGEEFVVILPDSDGAEALARLNEVLGAFGSGPADPEDPRTPAASFSAGVAVFPGDAEHLAALLSHADQALYQAKHQGRARVTLASPGR